MSLELLKYFNRNSGDPHTFGDPASEGDIVFAESQLRIELPTDYRDFIKIYNGFEGFVNEFYARFEPIEKIYQLTVENCTIHFPWAVYIGSDGGGEMFVINKGQQPHQFGLLPFIANANDFIPLGNTFEQFLGRLYNNNAFK